jgi:NAD(P)-dependent dehydrogenase (short-subunit alcohol dehydrogenase family)
LEGRSLCAEAAERGLGGLDLLVNNAGIYVVFPTKRVSTRASASVRTVATSFFDLSLGYRASLARHL